MDFVAGPDFPTGGSGRRQRRGDRRRLCDRARQLPGARRAGRSRRARRARWAAVVTEIPYQVPKGKLIEQIAQLIADRKLPILADVRDESDAEIRIVIEPRSRTVDPDLLMDSLFRLTDLEMRVPLNLNVLDAEPHAAGDGPEAGARANGSPSSSRCWSAARSTGSAKIDDRLELLEGYLIAFLNLDRVIQIIRTEDEPKPVMIAEFALTDRQAEAILNMRLRQLAPARGDAAQAASATTLDKEREELAEADRLARPPAHPAQEGPGRAQGPLRPRDRARPPPHPDRGSGAGARNPARGDDRARADHRDPVAARLDPGDEGPCRARPNAEALKFKEGDALGFPFSTPRPPTRLLLASSDGRFYTLAADRLPGGRGFGEPVKLMVDIEGEGNVVALLRAGAAEKLLLASSDGRGFVTSAAGAVAETRKGKQVVNLRPGAKLQGGAADRPRATIMSR